MNNALLILVIAVVGAIALAMWSSSRASGTRSAASLADAKRWLDEGCLFVAVGSDLGLLARGSDALRARFAQPA